MFLRIKRSGYISGVMSVEFQAYLQKMRPSINNERYYGYLFTYTDPPDDLFQASSLTELKEEGSFT